MALNYFKTGRIPSRRFHSIIVKRIIGRYIHIGKKHRKVFFAIAITIRVVENHWGVNKSMTERLLRRLYCGFIDKLIFRLDVEETALQIIWEQSFLRVVSCNTNPIRLVTESL